MGKVNVVQLHIINNTNRTLIAAPGSAVESFREGKVAQGNIWPGTVPPQRELSVTCCENDSSFAGCDGWANYSIDGMKLYFLFANLTRLVPTFDFVTHRIEVALEPSSVQDNMNSYLDYSTNRYFKLPNSSDYLVVKMKNYPGETSHAFWHLSICNPNEVVPANIEVNNVQAVFNKISSGGTREYYEVLGVPTDIVGLAKSHFKGVGFFKDKIIFSHTNIGPDALYGKYILADKIAKIKDGLPNIILGLAEKTYNTEHPVWKHPGGLQACGSYMAMGLQDSEDGSNDSLIQIYDIRRTQVNEAATLIGIIERTNGINGVAMTKQHGNGNYIVAGTQGDVLSIYMSDAPLTGDINTNIFYDRGSTQLKTARGISVSGAGIALVTQTDGTIFLFALDSDDEGTYNKMYLFRLEINPAERKVNAVPMGERDMPVTGNSASIAAILSFVAIADDAGKAARALVPFLDKYYDKLKEYLNMSKSLNSSFRWGKGIKITSPNSIEVFATDRNVIPLNKLKIPLIYSGDPREFSLVTWK